jgi:predicted lipoprotein with Yx(FWY)xxD motif
VKKQFAIAAALTLALLSAACGGDNGNDNSAYNNADSTTKTTAAAAAASGTKTLALKSNDELGSFLVGPNGKTLYLFEKDTGTTSACAADPCRATWPALTATDAPTAGDGVNASLASTATGQVANQVVYNGHLLYYFSGDTKPGDVNGLGIPSWYPVDASGNKIDKD